MKFLLRIKRAIKRIAFAIFNVTGWYFIRKNKYKGRVQFTINDLTYGPVFPPANYSPWLADLGFQAIYQKVEAGQLTLVDPYRLYEIWQLVKRMHQLAPHASMLEVGVWRGGSAAIMATQLKALGASAKLYLADTFKGVAKASEKDAFYAGGEHADTSLEATRELIAQTQYEAVTFLIGIFPDDTAHHIADEEPFSLVHIDVDVYDGAKAITEWVWPRLVHGGVLIFDDYGYHTTGGVTRYLNSLWNLPQCFLVHNINGHGIMIKLGDKLPIP